MKTRILVASLLSALFVSSACMAASLPRHALLGAGATDQSGVRINFIRPGSPADRAGLRVDDVVLSVAGAPVSSAVDFVLHVRHQPAGTPVSFAIVRQGKTLPLSITLDAAPDENDPSVTTLYQSVVVDGTARRTLVTVAKGSHGRHPAVLVVGGIGCYSVDNADPEDAYTRLTHDLARAGIVAMRLEKSGVGDSEGPSCLTVDLEAEMHSYEVALAALKHDPNVDRNRVYLFGHSIGSIEAPRIAEKDGAAGVIVAEGIGRNWIEYELWNLRRQLTLSGEGAADIDAALAEKEICMHALLIERTPEAEIEKTRPYCKMHYVYPAAASYIQQAAALNIAEPWTKLSVPLLAIYWTADFITARADHERIVGIVNAAHPGAATLKLIEGMDHHLDAAGTVEKAYAKPGQAGPYDEQLSAAVIDWLCARERCTSGAMASAKKN